jgi:hypothetical protein
MDSSVSGKDEIWFMRVCHHISNTVYLLHVLEFRARIAKYEQSPRRDIQVRQVEVDTGLGLGLVGQVMSDFWAGSNDTKQLCIKHTGCH